MNCTGSLEASYRLVHLRTISIFVCGFGGGVAANTDVGSVLGQRRRRLTNVDPTLDQCVMISGLKFDRRYRLLEYKMTFR